MAGRTARLVGTAAAALFLVSHAAAQETDPAESRAPGRLLSPVDVPLPLAPPGPSTEALPRLPRPAADAGRDTPPPVEARPEKPAEAPVAAPAPEVATEGQEPSPDPIAKPPAMPGQGPTLFDIATFDPRADDAYGAYQRGWYLTAFELALKRAQAGDAAAQTLIAEIYDKGRGIPRDGKEAAAWYELAARAGNHQAQFAYAVKLLDGRDIRIDRRAARELMEKAALAGLPAASFNYAQMLVGDNAAGIVEALPFYRRAAEAGVADAAYAMAQFHAEGIGVAKDDVEARRWLGEAARAGFDTAQVELGIWLANGRGGEKDEKAAYGWMERAARGGNAIAQNRLAKMLVLGIGTEPDPAQAAAWHMLARKAGLTDAWLDEFVARLDEATRDKAIAAARNWPSG